MMFIIIWSLGSIVAYSLLSVTIVVYLLKCIPTWFGLIVAFFHPGQLRVPAEYRWMNFCLSIFLSWAVAIFSIIVLIGIIIYNKHTDGKSKDVIAG